MSSVSSCVSTTTTPLENLALQTECEAAVHDTIPSPVTTPIVVEMRDVTTGTLPPLSTDQECEAELHRFFHDDSKARLP